MELLQIKSEWLQPGDYSDLYWEDTLTTAIRWEDKKVESFSSGRECGAGLRYMVGEENRYGYADDPASEEIHRLFKQLAPGHLPPLRGRVGMGGYITSPPTSVLPLEGGRMYDWSGSHPKLYRPVIAKPVSEISPEEKVRLIETAFKAASIPKVRQVSIGYGETEKHIRIYTSEGDATEEFRTILIFSITVVAEDKGLLQTAHEALSGACGFEFFDRNDVTAIARKVAHRAVSRLNAPSAPAGEMPIIIAAEAGGTLIHEAIGHPLEADAVQKGISPVYKGAIGKVVGNEKVSVLEDPTMPGVRGFYAFDDEGVPSQRVTLVDHGVLKTYLYDRQTARKDGIQSNGHGRRESFRHRPIPRMANTFVAPGPDDPKMILRSVRNGLLVTKMGGGQVETATGDFVFEVEEGFQIKDGQVGPLIRGANLIGNGPDVLKSIDLVGSDMGWSVGTCGKDGQGAPVSDGLPTLRIPKGVVVGGTI
jgi:TldD protein